MISFLAGSVTAYATLLIISIWESKNVTSFENPGGQFAYFILGINAVLLLIFTILLILTSIF
jgi:hypothetical protein